MVDVVFEKDRNAVERLFEAKELIESLVANIVVELVNE